MTRSVCSGLMPKAAHCELVNDEEPAPAATGTSQSRSHNLNYSFLSLNQASQVMSLLFFFQSQTKYCTKFQL